MDKFISVSHTGKRTMSTANSLTRVSKKVVSLQHKAAPPRLASSSHAVTCANNASIEEKPNNANIISVFTDGSCIQNTRGKKDARPAGYACVFPEYPSYNHSAKLLGNEKTNNRAEFSACIAAFQIAAQIDPKMQKLLYVYTDSELLINSLTKWLPGWKSKNWKKADGTAVKNIDLLKSLDEHMKTRVVVFRHVRAHTGKTDWQSVHNDMADKLAKKAALS